jgi:hypothetical protein
MFTVAPLTLMLFTIGIFVAPFYNPLFFLSPIGPALAMTAGAILHWIIAKHCPEQKVKNPLSFALFGFWWIINSFYLTVLCLLTLDFSDWGSRAKKLEPDPQTVMAEEGIPEFVFVTITAAGND